MPWDNGLPLSVTGLCKASGSLRRGTGERTAALYIPRVSTRDPQSRARECTSPMVSQKCPITADAPKWVAALCSGSLEARRCK